MLNKVTNFQWFCDLSRHRLYRIWIHCCKRPNYDLPNFI